MKKSKVLLVKKLMYGCGDIFGGGAFLIISLLYLNYLTDVEFMAPAVAGSIIMIGKMVDAIWDPLMGVISDRTKSRFGRRRIYFLVGIIPVFVSFSLLWNSFGIESKTYLFFYYLFTYILFNMVFSMVMVPYNSILPDMTNDYKERTSYTGTRVIFSVASSVVAGILPKFIINQSGSNIKEGYFIMAMIFGAIYGISWLMVFFGTWERKDCDLTVDNHNIFKELSTVFKNKCFRMHSGIFICGQAAVDFTTTLFIYYLTVCLNRGGEFSIVLGTLLISQLFFIPIHTEISKKYSKTAPIKFGFIIWAITLLSSLLINQSSPKFMIYIIAALSGIGSSASVLVPWSILPEVVDVDELITSKRREGVYAGMATFLRKMSNGVAIGVIGFALQLIGYVKPQNPGEFIQQSTTTIYGIKLMFGIVPVVFIILSHYFARKYSMTEEKHSILMKEIDRRKRNATTEIVDSRIKEVCEELTGINYNKLWSRHAKN